MQKLRIFIEDHDQNLKYLGLQAMSQVLKIAPKAVLPHRDLIVECLEDRDESIRLRALDLLAGMVNKKTLVDIVRKLLQHLELSDGMSYRDEVVGKIIDMTSQGHYQVREARGEGGLARAKGWRRDGCATTTVLVACRP